ncbi:hypothetical protein HID58_058347 [Brassica napus]|uniref:Uncharacterized protein n=1 Tax=Brassica napus TaxID=3708 RepID=A0ABQ7ZPX8_BRANA|nr:hypothetical protein HID58_058347 [Brassica napus]
MIISYATEITSVFLIDEVWTSTSHYVTIPQLSDIVVKAPPTHSSIVLNSLSYSIEDISCLVYLSVVFSVYETFHTKSLHKASNIYKLAKPESQRKQKQRDQHETKLLLQDSQLCGSYHAVYKR